MKRLVTYPLAMLLTLEALGAPAAQTPLVTSPATFSTGGQEKAPGLQSQAWWEAFGDPKLNELVRRAASGSLTLQQARARILQARATVRSAHSDRWPSVSAVASAGRSDTSDNATSPAVATSPTMLYKAGFDASWELDIFGGKRKTEEASQARYEATLENLRDAFLTLAGDVATNYITLRSDQALLDITRQNLETQRQTAKLTEERQRLGLTSGLDVAQAKAQLASTAADIPTLEASIRQSIHRISLLLGLDPTALVAELSPAAALPSAEGMIATGIPSELLERRPDLRSAERSLRAAMADIGAAKSDLYPKFDLTFGLGLQSTQTSTFGAASSRYWSIIPGLSLPIFNRSGLKAKVAQKEAIYQEALAAFRASYHTALEDVENALAAYYAEKGRRQDLEASLEQSQQALRLSQERYQRGLTSFLDVLTAQTSVQTAQRSLSQSKAKVLTCLVSLNKALGGGWGAPA